MEIQIVVEPILVNGKAGKAMEIQVTVEPILVNGNGIPFSPRTMFVVRKKLVSKKSGPDSVHEIHGARPAYFSQVVANRIALEQVKVAEMTVNEMMRSLMKG